MPRTNEVFGISNRPVLSYTERPKVDDVFRSAVEDHHHIVVYGSSKQGKTSLRQTYLSENQTVIVRASPTMSVEDIYSSILRQAGIQIETTEITSESAGGKLRSKTGFKAFIPWVGSADTEIEAQASASRGRDVTAEFMAFNFAEAQSVGELLTRASFRKFIVVENFHYLAEDIQQHLSFDLKTFHEIGVRFIILGIWRDANLLMTFNPDLEDRMIEIPVEPWEDTDFRRVATTGCKQLNVVLAESVIDKFLSNAYGNIGMFQEFLRTYCKLSDVEETGPQRTLDSEELAEQTFARRMEVQQGQLLKHLQGIASQSRLRSNEPEPLLLPYYICVVILKTPVKALQDGLHRAKLLDLIRDHHYREDKQTVRMSDLANLLQSLPRLQQKYQTPFLHYDSNSKKLKIVDTRQFFVLARVNAKEMLEEIQFPDQRDDLPLIEGREFDES